MSAAWSLNSKLQTAFIFTLHHATNYIDIYNV